jgi:hypothetical protein
MLTKTIIALAIAVVAAVSMSTGASAEDGFYRRAGLQDRTPSWGDGGCLVWRRGVDYLGRERLVQVDICR